MISKAEKHALEFINRDEWTKPWMKMIFHIDKNGAYELENPHRDSYYNVSGIYFLRIFLEDKVTKVGKWFILYVGASWGDKESTTIRPPEDNDSGLIASRLHRFSRCAQGKMVRDDGPHHGGTFIYENSLAKTTWLSENRVRLDNVEILVYPWIDLSALDWQVYETNVYGDTTMYYRTRYELTRELEDAFVEILKPLVNDHGETNYSKANGQRILAEFNGSNTIDNFVCNDEQLDVIASSDYSDLPAKVCVNGNWIN